MRRATLLGLSAISVALCVLSTAPARADGPEVGGNVGVAIPLKKYSHKIEGVGVGFTPPLWDPTLVDEIQPVATDDAKEMARRIAREEALFAGTSSGANVVAAIRMAERLGPGARVVTLMVDSGLKYLNTDVYKAAH